MMCENTFPQVIKGLLCSSQELFPLHCQCSVRCALRCKGIPGCARLGQLWGGRGLGKAQSVTCDACKEQLLGQSLFLSQREVLVSFLC